MHIKLYSQALAAAAFLAAAVLAHAGRALQPDDWYQFQALSDVQISPDGGTVAYLVTSYDRASDESRSALWITDWTSGGAVQLTRGESVSEPRFSPDGRFISFLTARPAEAPNQVWLLDRRGGEPRQLSRLSEEIVSYEWAPDGKSIVVVAHPSTDASGEDADGKKGVKTPKPIVVDSFQFKQDKEGYVAASAANHLFLLDAGSGAAQPLTKDPGRSDSLAVFSPDSRHIAYVSKAFGADSGLSTDFIQVIDATPGSTPRQLLVTESPNKQKLAWSPDGHDISFLRGDQVKYTAYITDRLGIVDASSGKARTLADRLDRAVYSPIFSADGRSILVTVEDDGYQYPASVSLQEDRVAPLATRVVVHDLATARDHVAVLVSSDSAPTEVYALEEGRLRPLSAHNHDLFAGISLGAVEDISFKSRDGAEIHGQLVKPAGYVAGRRYPTIVWIHGGPNGQDDHSLELWGYGPPLERQFFATHGYAVLAINYRGGTGRGAKFARSIFADWGHKEVEDLLAGVDYAVARGIADPKRLGIGGWSYGGILTDYTIATDPRFKAAISGAGSGNQTGMYGVDQYVVQYNAELGPPWRNTSLWLKLSYPFFHADRIHTPTLFLGGDKDFNVPLAGGEQMYQALRTLGLPARLVVYPGEYHVLTRPSFIVDRSHRYLEWMDRYLGGAPD